MELIRKPERLRETLREERVACTEGGEAEWLRLGFTPTLGALHKGHMSLIHRMVAECAISVVSVYVNPEQFDNPEDLENYPRTLLEDLEQCQEVGVDYVYSPFHEYVYEQPFRTSVEVGELTEVLEGAHREGHFAGVTLIVAKLLNLVNPDRAYFGEKDYQQLLVIEQMVDDLDMGTEIVRCPLVRDDDGLATSSRNRRLSEAERTKSLSIYRALLAARKLYNDGERDPDKLEVAGREVIEDQEGVELEYFAVRSAEDLSEFGGEVEDPTRALAAAWVGDNRLIDNTPLGGREE